MAFRNPVTSLPGSSITGALSDNVILIYKGTPGPGTLDLSLAPSAGTDVYGNAYPPGLTSGLSSTPQIMLQTGAAGSALTVPTHAAGESNSGQLTAQAFPGTSGSTLLQLSGPASTVQPDLYKIAINSSTYDKAYPATLEMAYVDTAGVTHPVMTLESGTLLQSAAIGTSTLTLEAITGQTADLLDLYDSSGNLVSFLSPSGRLQIQPVNVGVAPFTVNAPTGVTHPIALFEVAGVDMFHVTAAGLGVLTGALVKGAAGTADTWQIPTIGTGWLTGPSSGTVQVLQARLDALDNLVVAGTCHTTTTTSSSTFATLPAGYRPAVAQRVPVVINAAGVASVGFATINTSGTVTLGAAVTTSGTDLYISATVPMGNIA
jgi:hypothetical protein